jgi:prepilin-type N-terminal cleavage/methylation domain-containing protein
MDIKLNCYKKKAFSLIELLVVVSIIAVLMAVGSVGYQSIIKSGRNARRQADVQQIRTALESYKSDTGAYPANPVGSCATTTCCQLSGLVPSYLAAYPSDPSIPSSNYCYIGAGSTYSICYRLENGLTASANSACNTLHSNNRCGGGACNTYASNP